MSLDDLLYITLIMWALLISVIILFRIKDKGRGINMDTISKAKKDMIDLEKITKNIENNYKPLNIDLTSYEKEQESNAIISYDELIMNKNKKTVNYDDSYMTPDGIDVRKVDLNDTKAQEIKPERINVTLMSYEKEEAFLKALKQLKMDLAR